MMGQENRVHAARAALKTGDLSGAAEAMARGLWQDPADAQLLSLSDALFAACDDPAALMPLRPGMGVHEAGLHARWLGQSGDLLTALGLLMQLAGVDPEVPYLGCVPAWLEGTDISPEMIARAQAAT